MNDTPEQDEQNAADGADAVQETPAGEAGPAGAVQMQVPMVQLDLGGAQLAIERNDTGDRLLIAGPVILRVLLPMSAEGARQVGRELTGGIEIAGAIPPDVQAAGKRIVRR